MNNRELLIELIAEHKLDRREIAEMVKVKPRTVDNWLLPPESKNREEIPDMAVELLVLKLRGRTPPAGQA